MFDPRRGWSSIPWLALLLFGCGTESSLRDAGPVDSARPDVRVIIPLDDSDEDGLCDESELRMDLDPFDADSDGDTFLDGVEWAQGMDPRSPASPAREDLVLLPEVTDGRVLTTITHEVNGRGESYVGAFVPVGARDPFGKTALDYYDGAIAGGANPPDHVFAIEPEAERFVGATGQALLFFDLSFALGDAIPRVCVHTYPFRYMIKRESTGALTYYRRWLVVTPPASSGSQNRACGLGPVCF